MDKLIKYRKKFVEFCFDNGYDINKIRASKAVTVYECPPAEAWMWQSPFVIHVEDGTDIVYRKPEHWFENKDMAVLTYGAVYNQDGHLVNLKTNTNVAS